MDALPLLDPAIVATLTDTELAHTLRLDPAEMENVAKTFAQSPRSTIEPVQIKSDAPGRRAIAGLGEQRAQHGITAGLAVERTLGEGGMGIVRLATQRSLGRKVAVKTLKPESRTEQSTLRLLREAWVTGSLEHPNIVPVYDLGLDDDGSPIIILKNIEGTEWAALLRDEDEMRRRFGAADALEHNLRILVQLCNAVSLAHARGVLHRDLKPENVMIGAFGEVYLVDWGIAVSLREDPTGRLPYAPEAAKEIAGTPCYMAPEMLGSGELSEQTDVYLLGAVLHELLTGAPPHQGNFRQIIASVVLSTPTYGPEVPPELAQIARQAMAREPSARFASTDALRLRLEWYLRHRGSLALSTEASKRLAQMQVLVVEGEERERIYHLFAEARFGFRQALGASVDNDVARTGLREAIETIVAFELERGTPEAAAGALAELESPPASLVTRITQARERATKERARLAEFEAQHDPSIGRRTRLAAMGMLGLVWVVSPQLGPYLDRVAEPMRWMYGFTATLVVIAFGIGRWGRESLSKTLLNRRLRSAVLLSFAGQLLLEVGCTALHIPFAAAVVLHFVNWIVVLGGVVFTLEPKMRYALVGYIGAFLVACVAPSLEWHLMSLAHLGLVVNALLAWGSFREDRPSALLARRAERKRREA